MPARVSPTLERSFLGLTLFLKLLCAWRNRALYIGYDPGEHLSRVLDQTWWSAEPPIRNLYYGYHPPLGFLLPKLLFGWLGDPRLMATCFSTLCGIIAFLFLRATLKRLSLLQSWPGFAFLYLWAGLPIIVNCGISLNLDLPLLAWTSATLFFSVCLFRRPGPSSMLGRVPLFFGLILSLAGGMFTKFSGLLAFTLPFLTAFTLSELGRAGRGRQMMRASLPVLLAASLVFPYYWQRYYRSEGTFFPRNNEFFNPDLLRKGALVRDADRLGFIIHLVTPEFLQPSHPAATKDMQTIRLSDAWRDFFIRSNLLYFSPEPETEKMPPGVLLLGRCYRVGFSLLAIFGLVVWARSRHANAFARLGGVFLGMGLLFSASLAAYCYSDAIASFIPAKGIYILPATWAAAWLAVTGLQKWQYLLARKAGCALLGAWLVLNHLWPIY